MSTGYSLNIHDDNIASMTHTASTFKANLTIETRDFMTGEVVKDRLNQAIKNLGEDAEVELSFSRTSFTSTENQAF